MANSSGSVSDDNKGALNKLIIKASYIGVGSLL